MNEEEPRERRAPDDGPPPFLGSWSRVYAVVLGFLAFLIVVLRVFTVTYR